MIQHRDCPMIVRESDVMDTPAPSRRLAPPHEVLAALGDPARMEMVWYLATRGPMSLTSLVNRLPMSRQGATKHVKVLVQAGVLRVSTRGRRTTIELDSQCLVDATQLLGGLSAEWDRCSERMGPFVAVSGQVGKRRVRTS